MPSSEASLGFLLQPTYRIEGGKPVVHLYGVLESGGSFLVRDGREVPHFYVRDGDAQRAAAVGAAPLTATGEVTMAGEPVLRVEVPTPPETPALRQEIWDAGVSCYEADVRFAMRFLMLRGIRGAMTITGEWRAGSGIDRIYDTPTLSPVELFDQDPATAWTPSLRTLSFDIETDPKARRLLSIALVGCGVSEVLLFTPKGWNCPPEAVPFASEAALLKGFCQRVRELDPDVLTGWNVVDFDLFVLDRIAKRCGVQLEMGRGSRATLRMRESRGGRNRHQATIPGRVVLDGIDQVRGAFLRFDEYSLEFVSREVLGVGKLLKGSSRADEIVRLFKEDRSHLVEYNRKDAQLVLDILEKLKLVELAVERSLVTGMPPDRVASSVAAFDFLYLSELHQRGIVAPTVEPGASASAPTSGGHVLDPDPGLYSYVLIFDFKSLYPSLIRTFQIDPLGYLPTPGPGDDPIMAPNGAAFRREPGILTTILDRLFPRRAAAKMVGNEAASQAIKILMNSFYGVLGTPACRFHNPMLANAITHFGKELLLWMKGRFETRGLRVLYGDTDSLFVESGQDDGESAQRVGAELAAELNEELTQHLKERYGVESRMELEFEKVYLRLHLPSLKGGGGGARKRYAGLLPGEAGSQVELVGMEAVRRDTTELAKELQREIYRRLFSEEPLEGYVRQLVADLRGGLLDDQLVYKKALRKAPEAYTANTPPHVAAALRMANPPRRGVISYVWTSAGPEPALERKNPLDHEHYVDKQVRPIAEPVLGLLGLEFKKVVGDDRQLGLF